MKAYLVTTGVLFGLLAVLHVVRAVAEWPRPTVNPGFALLMAALVVVPGVLSLVGLVAPAELVKRAEPSAEARKCRAKIPTISGLTLHVKH